MKISNRISEVPHYVFARLEHYKKELIRNNIEIIDLSIGDPDIKTPQFIVDELINSLRIKDFYKYPPYSGAVELKKSIANFYKRHFDVDLDYENEVGILIGAKEGIAHLIMALTDPGDYCIVPDPGYPVYFYASIIAGCIPYKIYLQREKDYIPNIYGIHNEVVRKAKILIVNYPNNPTGACGNLDFYSELIDFGIKNDIVIVNDAAYINLVSDKKYKNSILQVEGAKKIAVEIGSLSKSYNMTGWRIGYIVGNKEIIKRLSVIKSNIDSGQFLPIQLAASKAIDYGDYFISYINNVYEERRKIVNSMLKQNNFDIYDSKGTFYVWFKVPKGYSSEEFCEIVLDKAQVMITPGNAFGDMGEGFCRISLTLPADVLKPAVERILKVI
ncbi:MAG: aminotransferase class I/II-fold pyridoxal phosphate-dependent enzyme [Caloramator sp.]|nr:aminotransferase class I/II-fold pyridoxal phosphate-dependent enzyme [Caloramator sp.]